MTQTLFSEDRIHLPARSTNRHDDFRFRVPDTHDTGKFIAGNQFGQEYRSAFNSRWEECWRYAASTDSMALLNTVTSL